MLNKYLLLFALCAGGVSTVLAGPLGAANELIPVAKKAPKLATVLPVKDAIPGQFIVATRQGASADKLAQGVGGQVLRRYSSAFQGFALQADPKAVLALLSNVDVRYIEQVGRVKPFARPAWQLDRLDQASLPLDGEFQPHFNGTGVHAYIIDTGVRGSHQEFSGRMGVGQNFAARNEVPGGSNDGLGGLVGNVLGGVLGNGDEPDSGERPDWDDCNGHGTHVAGSVGGTTYGVAKNATLHAVRVLDCDGSGSTADVIAGVDWVTANFELPSVANMSLGGGASRALDEAVANAVNKGLTMVVAAGNETQDACEVSPAREASAITVGASTIRDERAGFSNYGKCLDIFAPGAEIVSAWHEGDSATKELQGTSMAAPHVAGVVALLLAENGEATPADISRELESLAVEDRIGDSKGSPNRLLQVPTATSGQ